MPARADEASLAETVRQLQARIEVLEKKVAQQDRHISEQNATVSEQKGKITGYENQLSQFEEHLHRVPAAPMQLMEGLELGAGITMVVQGTDNVNDPTAGSIKKARTDGSYSADITLGKEFKEAGGRAFLHLEGGQGDGLNDNLALYSAVNSDADNEDRVHLTEVWYEQGLFNDKAALTVGKLDPTAYFDNNEAANDETTQFLGGLFLNNVNVGFPDNTAGIRLAYMPVEWLELGYGIFDGNSDWEKLGDNLFNIGQVSFKTDFFGLPGNYRFLGWHSNVYHVKWSDPLEEKESSYGWALSFDQKATDIITLFARYGWQTPEVYDPGAAVAGVNYSLEQSWSAGLQVEGKSWGREKDVLAFAVGQIFASDDYQKYAPARGKAEGHFEAYYKIQVNEHLALSPDFQYIWNPFGKDILTDTGGVFVGGLRAQVDF
ncbi:MAG: SlyX family protein [Candidatus Omnitrophica bacterium]|nr:SlyX family protein [Candidatus Omnitrophota bacterium]MDD5654828.1 SlyX family protein [Candidatus Omnitrophota bacterium]